MEKKKHSLIPGIFLIGLGLWMLADHVPSIRLIWTDYFYYVLLFCSALLFAEAIRKKNSSPVFLAVITLIIGSFFALRTNGIIFNWTQPVWPIFPFALGIAFFSLFLIRPQDWGVLIPGALFLFFSISAGAEAMFDKDLELTDLFSMYWPVVVIVIGIGVVVSGFLVKGQKKNSK